MKHSLKIVLVLLSMFLLTQIIGLAVIQVYGANQDSIPYGMAPPEDTSPTTNFLSIIFAVILAVVLMLMLMKYRIELFLRLWFFLVIILALGIAFNAALIMTPLRFYTIQSDFLSISLTSFIAFLLALPLAFLKVFKRNMLVHNLTELLIYPGIAAIFVPLLNLWTVVLLLVLISIYDMYAVWHSGIMQKMAKYQIQNVKVFSGFFIPYVGKKDRELIKNMREKKVSKKKMKKVKFNVAILGGGDVVFPIILAGVVLRASGFIPALIVSLCATLALAYLFSISRKGKFYPAMPFITVGCFIGLGIGYLLQML